MAEEKTEDDDVEALEVEGLPAFEGVLPVGVVNKLTGAGGTTITTARHIGDRAVLLVEAEVDNVAHDKTKKGVVRIQRFSVLELYELDGAGEGRELLRAQRTAYRLAQDDAKGLAALAFDDTAQPAEYVSDAGVILTAQEIAARRADGVELIIEDDALLTVEFEDGSRFFWPDDWAGTGQTLAAVGGLMRYPNGEPGADRGKVTAWLSTEDGAVLDRWTDEDEDARLRFVEADAEASETLWQTNEQATAIAQAADAEVAQLDDARRQRSTSRSVADQATAAEPWEGYDGRSAAGLRTSISTSDDVEKLQAAFAYEAAHKERRTVMVAFENRLKALAEVEGGDDGAA